jgi:protoheme ferro-lyase
MRWLAPLFVLCADAEKVGLLFASFGDAESCSCVEPYFKNALGNLVHYEIPVPKGLKPLAADLIWQVSKKETMAEYKAISPDCNTTANTQSTAQAKAVAAAVQLKRPADEVRGYMGTNFVTGDGCPDGLLIVDQLRRMRTDGVEKIVVVNQNGAQNSKSTIGIAYDDVNSYFASEGKDWQVLVLGIDDYSQTNAFNELVTNHTQRALTAAPFAAAAPADVCIVFTCHGVPASLEKSGDPYEKQIHVNYEAIRAPFVSRGYDVRLAFQNHGGKGQGFPLSLFPWSSPSDTEVIPAVAAAPCKHVVISGAISFLNNNDETLYDERIGDRRLLGNKTAFVPDMFMTDSRFVKYIAGIADQAIDRKGPSVRVLREPSLYQMVV